MTTTRFLAVSLAAMAFGAAHASSHLLTFDTGSDYQVVGTDYLATDGVTFTNGTYLNIGNFAGNPSSPGILFDQSNSSITMNSAASMTGSFGFYYAALYGASVSVYSGLDGTGSLLGSMNLDGTPNPYSVWLQESLGFSGEAHSVVLTGIPNYVGYDNLSFTTGAASAVPGPLAAVPFLAGLIRRRRAKK